MGGNQVNSLIVGVECSTSSPLVEADMDSEQNICTFRGRLGRCHRPIEGDGLCVMHLPKISSKEIDRLEPRERALAEDRTRKFSEELKILAEHAPDLASFEGFRFPAIQADYDSAIETILEFGSSAHLFHNCVFEDDVELLVVDFANVSFQASTFKGKAYFNGSTFNHKADFSRVHFCQGVQFEGVKFLQGGIFVATCFDGAVTFDGAAIADRLHFASELQGPCFYDAASFRGLSLESGAMVIFENLSLARTSFVHTDLEDICFRNVRWYAAGSRSKALADEFEPDYQRPSMMELLDRNYRQLVLNYESTRDFGMAEHFHVGEMEVRRKAIATSSPTGWKRALRGWCNVYNIYRIASKYGTSYWRALGVLSVLACVCAGLFLLAGFKRSDAEATRFIRYTLLPRAGYERASLAKIGHDYSEAVGFVLTILTFQKDRYYEPVGVASHLLMSGAVIIFAGQSALVLLAIRRKFRR